MKTNGSISARGSALRIAVIYLGISTIWIFGSDMVVSLFAEDIARVTHLQTIKGCFFLAVTSVAIYVMIYQSIAKRERSQQQLVEIQKGLRESEAKFRRIVDSNMIGLVFWTADGRITDANDAFLNMIGFTREDLAAGRVRWTDLTPQEYLHLDAGALNEMKHTAIATPFEKECMHKDGHRIPILVGGALLPMQTKSGVAYVLDITDRKRAEQQAHDLNEELQQANRQKDEFLALMSHELRTPITAIRLWSEILAREGEDPESRSEALAMIQQGAETQTQLINDLMDLTRILNKRLTLDRRPVDLVPVVQAAVRSLEANAHEQGIALNLNLDAVHLQVMGDRDRLQQVVWNLVSNSIKFTPSGGKVSVRLTNCGHGACITVTDTGEGIAEEFLPHVFDRFRQADTSTTRQRGGLGIGLALSKSLVELHGGSIHVRSEGVGRGATFWFELPLLPAPASVDDRSATQLRAASPVRPLDGVRVLVVEDQEQTLRAIARALKSSGATVFTAACTKDALETLPHAKPDVLLSDIGIPDQDGYALIREVRLREQSLGRRVPAVAVTAYAMEEDRQRSIESGFDRYLSKPVELDRLLSVVGELAQGDAAPSQR